ncbi:hypothetical protein [Aquimarina macrocephali]
MKHSKKAIKDFKNAVWTACLFTVIALGLLYSIIAGVSVLYHCLK